MKVKALKHSVLLLVLSIGSMLIGQSLTTKLSHSMVGVGGTFQVTFEANGNVSEVSQPDFSNFQVLSGPNQSSSTQIINGRYSSKQSISYQLKALKEGIFPIKPIKATVNGNEIQSNLVSIEVKKGFKTNKQRQAEEQEARLKKNIVLTTKVSDKKVFAGEPIILEVELYFAEDIVNYELTDIPSFSGFYSKDVSEKTQVQEVNYKGRRMNKAILKKYILIPQKAGKLTLPDLNYTFSVRQQVRNRDPFSMFFDRSKKIPVSAVAKGRKIEVKNPPTKGKPSHYKGAVGSFSLDSKLTKNSGKTNEAISLVVTLAGNGNIKFVEFPTPTFPGDIEVYDPKIKENIQLDKNGARGSKEYEFLLIPRYAGTYRLDPVNFSYFDPSKKEYVTLSTPEYSINIEGDKKVDGPVNGTSNIHFQKKGAVNMIANDIRYIATEANLKKKKAPYFNSTLFWLINGIIGLVMIGLGVFAKAKKSNNPSQKALNQKNANKLAKKHLAAAKLELDAQNKQAFYEAISKAIYGYTLDKLSIKNAELDRNKLITILRDKQVEDHIIQQLIEALEACDMARYAPSTGAVMSNLYTRVEDTIIELDKQLS